MQTRLLEIEGPAGRLEAILMKPAEPPRAAAVLCHAHPLHGGVMRYKLLFQVAKALRARGYAVLRFNFRGVGKSEGTHDEGRGERDDLRAALDHLEEEFPGLPILAGGFSFGSVMAIIVGRRDPRVDKMLAMGFPLESIDRPGFAGKTDKPRLFVQGENDQFGSGEAMRRFVDGLTEASELVVIEGADHFFTGKLDALERAVTAWV